MNLKTLGRKEVKETRRGVYLWRMPDNSFISDGEGRYLMIEAMEGDQERLRALLRAVKDFGVDEGAPCFFRGNRIVDDEEYEYQKQRFEWGLVPDPLDVASIREDQQNANRRRK